MKGFTRDHKFHPIKKYNKVRKKQSPSTLQGVRIRKERTLQKIQEVKYFGEPSEGIVKMTPEEFLDKASSSGLEHTLAEGDKNIRHNTAITSDLGGVHADDPKRKFSISRDVSQNDWFPDEGQNTINKILRTGTDERPSWRIYDMKDREIFRGDELGTIEYLKRKIRHGQPIERPMFSVDEHGKITSHEGRHRSRALFEEGIPEQEVKIYGRDEKDSKFFAEFPNRIIGQHDSLKDFIRKIELRERYGQPLEIEYYSPKTEDTVKVKVKITPELKRKLLEKDTRSPIT